MTIQEPKDGGPHWVRARDGHSFVIEKTGSVCWFSGDENLGTWAEVTGYPLFITAIEPVARPSWEVGPVVIPEFERRSTPQDEVVDLIRGVGVHRLGYFDGCPCSSFSVLGVEVDISCGRGRKKGVWIVARSSDYWDFETGGMDLGMLRPIGEEVARQLDQLSNRGPFEVHYREWNKDLDSDCYPPLKTEVAAIAGPGPTDANGSPVVGGEF